MSVPVFRATRTRCAPILDGDIRIEFSDAFATDAFRTNAGPAEQRTEMFAGYDDEALYLAFVCHESAVDALKVDDLPCSRRAILRARYSHDDSIQVLIDPCRDGVHYRQLPIRPRAGPGGCRESRVVSSVSFSSQENRAVFQMTPSDPISSHRTVFASSVPHHGRTGRGEGPNSTQSTSGDPSWRCQVTAGPCRTASGADRRWAAPVASAKPAMAREEDLHTGHSDPACCSARQPRRPFREVSHRLATGFSGAARVLRAVP